jgi:outer membrane protein OmpA-like peptidoglycan-associated protein
VVGGRGLSYCGSSGNFYVLGRLVALLFTLVLSNLETLDAALGDALSEHQAARDALFNTLSASTTNYTFKYVVIHLPAGAVPGKNFSIPVSHVRYDSTLFFRFDQFVLQPNAEPILRDLAKVLKQDKALRSLLIVGHTDSSGPDYYNVTLSKKRAFTVAQSLQAAAVNAKYIGIIPMGKEQPFATNSTKEGRALNRRVEFFISDIPEATEKAIQLIPFNPCFRNDQTPGDNTSASACDNTPKRIPIYSLDSDTKARGRIDLTPIERPKLPDNKLERPRLRELENPTPSE